MQIPTTAIHWEREGDITYIRFRENMINEEAYANRASDELRKLATGIGGRMVLSLANVKFMSSPGMSAIITFNKLLRSLRGHLKICEVQPLVMQMLRSARFDTVFEIHETKAAAAAAFTAGPVKKAEKEE